MRWFKRRSELSAGEVRAARCPDCACELPIPREQAMLLAEGGTAWVFCPCCTRIVAAEPVVRPAAAATARPAPASLTAEAAITSREKTPALVHGC